MLNIEEVYKRNREIFKETRDISNNKYNKATIKLINLTRVYDDASVFIALPTSAYSGESKSITYYRGDSISRSTKQGKCTCDMSIDFTKESSIEAAISAIQSQNYKKVAVLNFADAEEPGGLVFQGEVTQEECLCRCSNLYESLSIGECRKRYYNYNRSFGVLSSDRLIYSPAVTVFRDDKYNLLPDEQVVNIDIITSPAPLSMVATEELFINRIKCIIGAAYHNNVDCLILGAWGTGAFGNDPYMVARAFKTVLDNYKVVKKIIFAIPSASQSASLSASSSASSDIIIQSEVNSEDKFTIFKTIITN